MSVLDKLPAGAKLPIKVATLVLDGDYEGWALRVRVNPPCVFFDEFVRDDATISERASLLASMTLEWNFVGEDGKLLGKPDSAKMQALPSDLLLAIMSAYDQAVGEVTAIPKA